MTARSLIPREEPSVQPALEQLAARVESSSNFRFAWQFFSFVGFDTASPAGALGVLQALILSEECHQFLRDSIDPAHGDEFEIAPIHEHCTVVEASGELEGILAAAANDHLGAYSLELRDSTPAETNRVRAMFEPLGPYHAFLLAPGEQAGCATCSQHNNHVFSSWFYGVAWDWCLILTWPKAHRVWVGCLTDTD